MVGGGWVRGLEASPLARAEETVRSRILGAALWESESDKKCGLTPAISSVLDRYCPCAVTFSSIHLMVLEVAPDC